MSCSLHARGERGGGGGSEENAHRWRYVRGARICEYFTGARFRDTHEADAELIGAAFDAQGDGHYLAAKVSDAKDASALEDDGS